MSKTRTEKVTEEVKLNLNVVVEARSHPLAKLTNQSRALLSISS